MAERWTNPTPWHREMRGEVINAGLELNEQTDAVLALIDRLHPTAGPPRLIQGALDLAAENARLRAALDIARTALLKIERKSEEARAELTRAHEQSAKSECRQAPAGAGSRVDSE